MKSMLFNSKFLLKEYMFTYVDRSVQVLDSTGKLRISSTNLKILTNQTRVRLEYLEH